MGAHILQITVTSHRRAGNWVLWAFPQHQAAAHDSFSQTQTAQDRLDNGHSSEPGNQETGGPNLEEQVSHWKAQIANLSWRTLVRYWCRFCPQFGFRNPETVSTKTNAPCHFPRRWAILPLQIKTSGSKQCYFIPHSFSLSRFYLIKRFVGADSLWRTGFLDLSVSTN